MKYKIALAAAAIAAGISGSASAQDLTGFRIEARGGWEQANASATLPNPDEDEDVDGDEFLTGSEDDSGVTYGVEFGYDYQVGDTVVIGTYAGIEGSDSEICGEVIGDDLACAGLGRTFTIGARVGVPIGKTSLIYAKGGYSNSRFSVSYDGDVTDNDDDEPGPVFEWSDDRDGYHVGGGVEIGLMGGLYGKLEYVYTNYDEKAYRPDGADPEDPSLDIGSDRHQVVAGIGLRF